MCTTSMMPRLYLCITVGSLECTVDRAMLFIPLQTKPIRQAPAKSEREDQAALSFHTLS